MATIEELRRDIEIERKKVRGQQTKQAMEIEKRRLKKELFQLRHKVPITLGQKGVSLIRKSVKKAAPIVKKQVRLIREQDLRDEAIEKKRRMKRKKKPKKKTDGLGIFEPLDF